LEQISFDEYPLRILDLEQVLHEPLAFPGRRLEEVIVANLDVRGNHTVDEGIVAAEDEILARALDVVVDDLVRSRSSPPSDRLRITTCLVTVTDVGIDDCARRTVERNAATDAARGGAVDVQTIEHDVVGH